VIAPNFVLFWLMDREGPGKICRHAAVLPRGRLIQNPAENIF
jgi:hypothetical protein